MLPAQELQPSMDIPDRTVVVDAGALIRMQRVDRLGKSICTTSGVINEIKDENARAHVQRLPVPIKLREPSEKDIKWVRSFASKTGDLPFLSKNDIDLIALTYMLQRETRDVKNLRLKPMELIIEKSSVPFAWGPSAYERKLGIPQVEEHEGQEDVEVSKTDGANESSSSSTADNTMLPTPEAKKDFVDEEDEKTNNVMETIHEDDNEIIDQSMEVDNNEGEQSDEDGDDDDDKSDGEWVTSDNIHRYGVAVGTGSLSAQELQDVKVACITTDYAVQNVCIQMGLYVLSFDGYRIRKIKLWGLMCRACLHFTRDTSKLFCPSCGHNTVDKVPISVSAEGQVRIHDNRRKKNLRGAVYSIPKPKGGKSNKDLILAEDQLYMGGRDREIRHQQRLFEKEKQDRDPFNEDIAYEQRGWCTRKTTGSGKTVTPHAPRVTVGFGRGNPNSNRFQKRRGGKRN